MSKVYFLRNWTSRLLSFLLVPATLTGSSALATSNRFVTIQSAPIQVEAWPGRTNVRIAYDARAFTLTENFLLELGNDFAFVGRQKRLRIGHQWFRVDLLLFHRRLRSLIIIDLKLGELPCRHRADESLLQLRPCSLDATR